MKLRSRSTRLAVFEYEKEYIRVNINSYKRGSEIQGAQAAAKIKGMLASLNQIR